MISTQFTSGMSISEWGAVLSMSPWILAQVIDGLPREQDNGCEEPLFQQAFQHADTLSRDEVVEALDTAERLISNVVGFFPVRRFIVNERVKYPVNYNNQALTSMWTPTWRSKPVELEHRNITGLGVEAFEDLADGAALVYSDPYTDGFETKFTITVLGVDANLDPKEVAVFFTETDRKGEPIEFYEIKPIRASISDTTLTIEGHKALCVLPEKYLVYDAQKLNVSDISNYATTVDVKRRYIDTTNQGMLIWENFPCATGNCTVNVDAACFQLRDGDLGLVAPIDTEITNCIGSFFSEWGLWRVPDRLTINYTSGDWRDDNGYVSQRWRTMIAKLATALLPEKTAGCKRADQRLRVYQMLPREGETDIPTASEQSRLMASQWFSTEARGAVEVAAQLLRHQAWGAAT